MHIDLQELRKAPAPLELHGVVSVPQVAAEDAQVEHVEQVQVDGTAAWSDHICRVNGELKTVVKYVCSRCLDTYEAPLRTELEASFTDERAKADDDTHFVGPNGILLDPYVEEAVVLAVDYCPVCSDACQGLCPVCGVNRNKATCHCDTRTIDPRLAALQDLLSHDDSE